MMEIDPRTKMLLRMTGFIIFLIGLIGILIDYTSPDIGPLHQAILALFSISLMIIGFLLMIPHYQSK